MFAVCSDIHYVVYIYVVCTKTYLFTLPLQDPHAEEFEDKEWTFVIENVSAKLSLSFCSLIFVIALTLSFSLYLRFFFFAFFPYYCLILWQ